MRNMGNYSRCFIILIAIKFCFYKGVDTCSLSPVYEYELKGHIILELYQNNSRWYNMSVWGGHVQIPWIGNVDEHCPYRAAVQYYLSLSEQHISIDEIGDQVQRVDACIHNQTDACLMNVTVEMRTCDGFLFYKFPYIESLDKEYVSYTNICP
ncbi:uncharacterized protein LOC132737490, partial [Ruditapes philippinarum]|uniref:uncharacterized protein LOC132737490 n=1 Tax=Ruditapes philippinarum TaxID=129788 RepID=UPI00295A8B13